MRCQQTFFPPSSCIPTPFQSENDAKELKSNIEVLTKDLESSRHEAQKALMQAKEMETTNALTASLAKEGWEERENSLQAQVSSLNEKIKVLQGSVAKEREEKARGAEA